MKLSTKLLVIAVLLTLSYTSRGGEVIAFGGAFAYNGGASGTELDYRGMSPNGYFGIKYKHSIDKVLRISTGIKHESSMPYKEVGSGFNGAFLELELKLF